MVPHKSTTKIPWHLAAGCLMALAMVACSQADSDYDGIPDVSDCFEGVMPNQVDLNVGCGCDLVTKHGIHGCPVEVNNPPTNNANTATDGGTPDVPREGELRKCGAKAADGSLMEKGVCRTGLQTYHNGSWGDCQGATVPLLVEKCNGADDDCNGITDEGFDLTSDVNHCGTCDSVCTVANGTAGCVAGKCVIKACATGNRDIDGLYETGCERACYDTNVNSTTGKGVEICDDIDNNCDGNTDEGDVCECQVIGATRVCGPNIGICHAGVQTCEVPGKWGPCSGTLPAKEKACNGQDNFCDGVTDEGFDKMTDPNNCGYCGRICHFDHATALCVAGECKMGPCQENWYDFDTQHPGLACATACVRHNGGVEACNGIDDNCNSPVDEGYDLQTDGNNCGACNVRCAFANAVGSCSAGACKMGICVAGFVDLDKNPLTGCEYACVGTANAEVCGNGFDDDCNGTADDGCACDPAKDKPVVCGTGAAIGMCKHGSQTCQSNGTWSACAGLVNPAPADQCDALDHDCDGSPHTGFDLATDVNNCGACGRTCAYVHATASCVGGKCLMGACDPLWYNTDGNTDQGCTYPCVPGPNGGVETCNGRDDNCDGHVDERFDAQTDANNCGACNVKCALPHVATQTCKAGVCTVTASACATGSYDVNRDPIDGCEYTCTPTANPAEACDALDNDCNGSPDDGITCNCVNSQTRSCGTGVGICEPGFQTCVNGAWSTCAGGKGPGQKACNGEDNLCDGQTDEGFNKLSDPLNCNGCGIVCSYAHATPLCTAGVCLMGACVPDWWDANHDTHDGCEHHCIKTSDVETCNGVDDTCDGTTDEGINKLADPLNCSACNVKCAFANAGATCANGVCQMGTCSAGYVDLDKNQATGCEYVCTKTANVDACDGKDENCDGTVNGGCACDPTKDRPIACGPVTAAGTCEFGTQTCANGTWGPCVGAVLPGTEACDNLDHDCDGVIHNGFNLATDVNNCGTCGNVCRFADATATCVAGVCQMGACAAYYYNADGNIINGCEYGPCVIRGAAELCNGIDDTCDGRTDEGYNTQTDPLNCGACGNKCVLPHVTTQTCQVGVCTVAASACATGSYDVNHDPTDGCEYTCTPTANPAEICDKLDNDCDGIIDNVVPACP